MYNRFPWLLTPGTIQRPVEAALISHLARVRTARLAGKPASAQAAAPMDSSKVPALAALRDTMKDGG